MAYGRCIWQSLNTAHTINICYQLKKIILKILLCKTNSNMLRYSGVLTYFKDVFKPFFAIRKNGFFLQPIRQINIIYKDI